MRMILASLLILSSAGVAMAQKEPFKPAPVPGTSPGTVAPADRAGRSNATDNAAPFAGAPASPLGQTTPSTSTAPEKDSAPAPSLSR